MSYKFLQAQALVDFLGSGTFIVPLKADPRAPACVSEYYDDDLSLMPIKDAMSDDYAMGTWSSEEC